MEQHDLLRLRCRQLDDLGLRYFVPAGDDWTATFSSPEDAILKKLEYFREGGSEKHLRDIAGVIGTMRQDLDVRYIEQWATRLGVADLWRQVAESRKI